jgi:hypothetical protein
MQNFWGLLLALSNLTGQHTAADVAGLAETMMELKINNEYIRLYKSVAPIQLKLDNSIVIATVEAKELKQKVGKPLLISLQNLQGACLTRAMLEEHMTEFIGPIPPSEPSPDAVISLYANFSGKSVWMGFKWSNSECLSKILLNFD